MTHSEGFSVVPHQRLLAHNTLINPTGKQRLRRDMVFDGLPFVWPRL